MMSRIFFFTIIIYLAISGSINAKTRFFIQTIAEGDQNGKVAEGGLKYYEIQVANKIEKDFPCAQVISFSDVRTMLGHERMRQLLGSGGDETTLRNLSGSMGCEYLLILNINVSLNKVFISAKCIDSKKAKVMVNILEVKPYGGGAVIETIDKVVNMLSDKLKEYEICHYYGPVTIEVKSNREEAETFQIGSPCGVNKANVTATRKTTSTLKWELNKYTLRAAEGTVKYDLFENYTTVTNFPCYKCKNGNQGPAVVTEIRETEAKAEGLSDESVSEGKKVSDARIKIVFLEDGTYTLLVEATSKRGPKKDSEEKKIEGICENESEPKTTKNKQIDVPINVVLGPYKGTTQDKVLQQKETKDLSQGKEKTTVTIDFTLTRSEN
jgi:hypothetical protein